MAIYKAKQHSNAVKLMITYYINMCGYKIFAPNIEGGVFAVASKENNLILTLLDDKSIKKTDRYGKDLGFFSKDEFDDARCECWDIMTMTSQDE